MFLHGTSYGICYCLDFLKSGYYTKDLDAISYDDEK